MTQSTNRSSPTPRQRSGEARAGAPAPAEREREEGSGVPPAGTDVDLHVHTVTSNCGYTGHQRLLDLTLAAGRRVVAVTDHDTAAGGLAVAELAARRGDDLLVIPGMELTTSDLGHVIVFGRGVERDWGWRNGDRFPQHIPDHWVAIQAHPFRGKVTPRAGGTLDVAPLPALPERIDAVELWNGGDVLKKTPHLRAEFDRLSRAYIEENGKRAVASSDGHRPIWIHTFFTRFPRPIETVDDLVDQIKDGTALPQAADEATLAAARAAWRRREVVEWHERGQNWRALAAAAGYDPVEAECLVAQFLRVQHLDERGAAVDEIAGAVGLPPAEVLDYLGLLDEERCFVARRRQ